MGPGKAFELFVKRILVNIGFSEVVSDGLYIYDGTPGQMIQGLGEAHNADVLLEPPVQTPFYSKTRLLIECKDYRTKISLNVVRSALGLREDINNFNIVDMAELKARRRQNRRVLPPIFDQYSYQVAIAALSGFTTQAQEFAAAYRIPLIEFNKLPFWNEFCQTVGYSDFHFNARRVYFDMIDSENRLLNWRIKSVSAWPWQLQTPAKCCFCTTRQTNISILMNIIRCIGRILRNPGF